MPSAITTGVLPFAARASTCSSHADEADAGASIVGTTRIPEGFVNFSLAVKVSWMNGLWRRSLNRQYSFATKLDTHTATATRTSRNVNRNTDVPGATGEPGRTDGPAAGLHRDRVHAMFIAS